MPLLRNENGSRALFCRLLERGIRRRSQSARAISRHRRNSLRTAIELDAKKRATISTSSAPPQFTSASKNSTTHFAANLISRAAFRISTPSSSSALPKIKPSPPSPSAADASPIPVTSASPKSPASRAPPSKSFATISNERDRERRSQTDSATLRNTLRVNPRAAPNSANICGFWPAGITVIRAKAKFSFAKKTGHIENPARLFAPSASERRNRRSQKSDAGAADNSRRRRHRHRSRKEPTMTTSRHRRRHR